MATGQMFSEPCEPWDDAWTEFLDKHRDNDLTPLRDMQIYYQVKDALITGFNLGERCIDEDR